MIDFRLTEEQLAMQKMARDFADREIRPIAPQLDRDPEHRFSWDMMRKLAANGFLRVAVPEEYGGLGLNRVTLAVIFEELAVGCAGVSIAAVGNTVVPFPVVTFGSEEQKRAFLPPLCDSQEARLCGYALTEPDAGSDITNLSTTARLQGDHYIINGTKRFITNGSVAGLVTVFAVTNPEGKRYQRLSCFVVEVPTEGFRVARLEHKLGIRGSPTAELEFTNVRVPAANRIGEEGDGWSLAMRTFERSRPGIAAQAVGIAQGALDAAVDYARQRKQFGQRIGDFQMVQAMLADMDAQTEAARQLLYTACEVIESGAPDAARWAAMCKLVAGDTAMRVTTDAVQVFGGYGYVDEFPVERMMRDAKITQLYEGTQQIQRLVIARALLGRSGN